MPLDNRGPVARNRGRELEVEQLTSNLEAITSVVRADVETAAREVDTTYREMLSRRQAMDANEAEIRYLTDRWRLLPGDQQYAGVMLDELLSAQERLATAEAEFASSEVNYAMARVELRRTAGTLLDDAQVGRIGGLAENLPALEPGRAASPPVPNLPRHAMASGEPARASSAVLARRRCPHDPIVLRAALPPR